MSLFGSDLGRNESGNILQSEYIKRIAAATLGSLAIFSLSGCGGASERDLVASAKVSLEKRDLTGAIVQLKAALQKEPKSGEVRFMLGEALLKAGDAAAASLELEKAQELKFDDNKVLPLLAQALLEAGQPKKVTDRYSNVELRESKASAALRATVATAFGAQGMLDLSESAMKAAQRFDPKNISARLLEARLKAGKGAIDDALMLVDSTFADDIRRPDALILKGELLRFGKRDIPGAIKTYREALAIEPRYMPAHLALIDLLLQSSDIVGFKTQYSELKKVLPGKLETRFFGIQLSLVENNLGRAREEAQQLLRLVPDNALVLELAGAVEVRGGSLILAEELLRKALKQEPNLTLARRLIAEVQLRSGQPDKALISLQPLLDNGRPGAMVLALVAQAHLQIGDTAKAEAFFTQASKLNPGDPVVGTALALAQIAKGNTAPGIGQLETLASVDANTYADLALISVLLRTNALDAALKAVDRLQTKLPDKALPHELRARIYLQRKDRASARLNFEKALAADPLYFPAVAALAGLDMIDKKPDEAAKRFQTLLVREPKNFRALLAMAELRQRVGAKPDEIADLLVEAVKLNPGEVEPRLTLIEHRLAQRKAAAALGAAQEAVAAIPNNQWLLDSLGRAQLAVGDSQQAIATLRKVAAMQPNLPQPQLRLAEAYMVSRDYPSAAQSLRRALEISPKLLVAQRGLIKVALAERRMDDALKVARSVQKERPAEAVGYLLEVELHEGQRKWESAIAAMRAALERERTAPTALRLHALYLVAGQSAEADKFAASWQKEQPRDTRFLLHLGLTAMDKKDFAEAEVRFRQALALRAEDPIILNNLAMALVYQGKPGAVAFAERAQQLLPMQASVMDTLAQALASENQLQKAILWQRKAIEKASGMSGMRLSLAKLLIKSGDKAAARVELEALSKLGASFPAQAEVANLLKTL